MVVRGAKSTDNEFSLVECDDVNIVANNVTITYPEPEDITGKIDTYSASANKYITVTGYFSGSTVTVSGPRPKILLV